MAVADWTWLVEGMWWKLLHHQIFPFQKGSVRAGRPAAPSAQLTKPHARTERTDFPNVGARVNPAQCVLLPTARREGGWPPRPPLPHLKLRLFSPVLVVGRRGVVIPLPGASENGKPTLPNEWSSAGHRTHALAHHTFRGSTTGIKFFKIGRKKLI